MQLLYRSSACHQFSGKNPAMIIDLNRAERQLSGVCRMGFLGSYMYCSAGRNSAGPGTMHSQASRQNLRFMGDRKPPFNHCAGSYFERAMHILLCYECFSHALILKTKMVFTASKSQCVQLCDNHLGWALTNDTRIGLLGPHDPSPFPAIRGTQKHETVRHQQTKPEN